jgi:hypothetical protein
MPTGPKGEKRPADVIGNAVKVMRIATGKEARALQKMTDCVAKPLREAGIGSRSSKIQSTAG